MNEQSITKLLLNMLMELCRDLKTNRRMYLSWITLLHYAPLFVTVGPLLFHTT